MDELAVFRGFRSGVAAPTADVERRAVQRLTDAIERPPAWGTRVLRPVQLRSGRTVLAFAVLAGAAAAALFVTSPWQSSPGFLERAEAALIAPQGSILHMKWDVMFTSEDPACTSTIRHEVWIDTQPPHRFRAVVPGAAPAPPSAPGAFTCPNDTPSEVGGENGKEPTLRFVPPNSLVRTFGRPLNLLQEDPWAFVGDLIAEGRAHLDGKTVLDGRTVERVRLDPAPCPEAAAGHCPTEPEYGYFDPETLDPVQWDFARDPMFPGIRNRWRYSDYEYLPRTEANLALTDIRAQHPNAVER